MAIHSNTSRRKWDIAETFCYSYICQSPKEYWGDEKFMAEREFLMNAITNSVHTTNWKQIFKEYSEMRPVTLGIKHAKEFYEAEVQNEKTEAYRAIESYFVKTDRQREIIRNTSDCDIHSVIYYLRDGQAYSPTKNNNILPVTKKKKK